MENDLKEQHFWTVQLLPLRQEDKKNISMCIELQEKVCIEGKEKIFGMGWTDDNNNFLRELFSKLPALVYSHDNNTISKKEAEEIIEEANKSIEDINKGIKKFNKSQKNNKDMKKELKKIIIETKENMDVLDFYKKIYDAIFGESSGLSTAINHYKDIRKDDLVIARLKSGKYCIGRVKNNKIICMGKNNEYSKNADIQDNILLKKYKVGSTGFSWCMSVYKWYVIEEYDIPGHISGRFSGRSAWKTICPVKDKHMQQLMKIIYYKCEQKDKKFEKNERLKYDEEGNNPIQLKIDNIAISLSPYELEDLVFLYIMDKHENDGFKLLPSKCKIDEVRYECYIINENNTKEVIAFQVKNQEKIDCSNYVDKNMKKIYLYSGVGYTWKGKDLPKNNKKIEEIIKKKSKTDNIEIVSDEQLFNIYINSQFFKYQLEKGYYTL